MLHVVSRSTYISSFSCASTRVIAAMMRAITRRAARRCRASTPRRARGHAAGHTKSMRPIADAKIRAGECRHIFTAIAVTRYFRRVIFLLVTPPPRPPRHAYATGQFRARHARPSRRRGDDDMQKKMRDAAPMARPHMSDDASHDDASRAYAAGVAGQTRGARRKPPAWPCRRWMQPTSRYADDDDISSYIVDTAPTGELYIHPFVAGDESQAIRCYHAILRASGRRASARASTPRIGSSDDDTCLPGRFINISRAAMAGRDDSFLFAHFRKIIHDKMAGRDAAACFRIAKYRLYISAGAAAYRRKKSFSMALFLELARSFIYAQ